MSQAIQHTDPMQRIRRIHFIGIGGVGMGGIAKVLCNRGYEVSGSDLKPNTLTKQLEQLGATVYFGHDEKNITDAEVIVVSSAIDENNPEIIAARAARIPIIPRAQMLAELMRFSQGIAFAGTHGKTTTTSLTATLLTEANLDPTYVIGGILNRAGNTAQQGKSPYFLAEADESDASFLFLHPMMAVVTNIDADHMDTYHGNFEELKRTFIEFLHHLPFYGLAVLCYDDPVIREILPRINRPVVTYGFMQGADVHATAFQQNGLRSTFTINWPEKIENKKIELNLAGQHNALNSMASIILAHSIGIEWQSISAGLNQFAGVGRRFQMHELVLNKKEIWLVDDYGHHPNEVLATIRAARQAWPEKRLVVAFQPHRYTRTRDLFKEFVNVLTQVDQLILLDVYSAGEKPIPGVTGEDLFHAIQMHQPQTVFLRAGEKIGTVLNTVLKNHDVLILQGAGDIGAIAARLIETEHAY